MKLYNAMAEINITNLSIKYTRHMRFNEIEITINNRSINTYMRIRARTHWTDKICLALPKISTNFVSAKFSICQSWAH